MVRTVDARSRANRFSSALSASFIASCSMARVFASGRSLWSVMTRMYARRAQRRNVRLSEVSGQIQQLVGHLGIGPVAERANRGFLDGRIRAVQRCLDHLQGLGPAEPAEQREVLGRFATDRTPARLASTSSERSAPAGSLSQTIRIVFSTSSRCLPGSVLSSSLTSRGISVLSGSAIPLKPSKAGPYSAGSALRRNFDQGINRVIALEFHQHRDDGNSHSRAVAQGVQKRRGSLPSRGRFTNASWAASVKSSPAESISIKHGNDRRVADQPQAANAGQLQLRLVRFDQ